MRPDLFREHLHLVEQFLYAVGGKEQSEKMRHPGQAERIRALDHCFDAANQIDVLRIGGALSFQSRFLKRLEMLEHLALSVARNRLLLVAAEMHDVLRS